MAKSKSRTDLLISKAQEDSEFRDRLEAAPRETIEVEYGIRLPNDHEVTVHQETYDSTHVVLPPRDKYSKEEREEAKTGVGSLEFLRKTLFDPAPPLRAVDVAPSKLQHDALNTTTLVNAGRSSIQQGLEFLESTVNDEGAWHCIRFNIAKPEIPRHFERPPFISAFGALALGCSNEERAKNICARTKSYLAKTIEYPGVWRYYRHLPTDLDSTSLCSLALDSHPWILLGRNINLITANRDDAGLFTTWIHADDEPDVVSPFRLEADPVVNANVIAYLGDRNEIESARDWLATSVKGGTLDGASKWYPDVVAAHYAISRAAIHAPSAFKHLCPLLADQILEIRDESGNFANILQTAQAVSALYNIGGLEKVDAKRHLVTIIDMQREDGSWPELLAFGDQSLNWGALGQIGHGSEAVTGAFCIEALERLLEHLRT